MTDAIAYERHDNCNILTTLSRSKQRRSGLSPGFSGLLIVLSSSQLFFGHVAAAPLEVGGIRRSISLERRDDDSTVSPKIWVPVLVITAVLAVLSILSCKRNSVRGRFLYYFSPRNNSTRQTPTNAQGTREITAEQLAGTINGTATPAGATPGRTRRGRRPRRTPSQISTASLPAYNKEPGEEELVIFRGPQDMEDAGMPTAIVMPPVSEDGEDSIHSPDNSQPERYTTMPTSPHDMPLLHDDTPTEHPQQAAQPPGEGMPRRSLETLNSSDEASSLMRTNSNIPDPRGEAPPYFESIDPTQDISHNGPASAETTPSLPPTVPSTSLEGLPPRRSGFRTLLNSLPNRISMSHASTPSHTRAESSLSMVSSDTSHGHGREASRSRASHRANQSSSGSLLNLSPFRTISRQKSINTLNLNSPSLISLNSISAPLTHTVVRTEFTYPKAGPTPEQLKLISSRESFALFGMPYGADAIAYAASASHQDLGIPPPGFDLQPSEVQHSPVPAGPSRLRAASNAAELEQIADESASSSENDDDTQPTQIEESTSGEMPNTIALADTTKLALTTSPLSLSVNSSNSDAPPTSFRAPSTFDRSESRASSMQSYATAAENMGDPHPPVDSSTHSPPTTPRMVGQHVLEATDATATQTATPAVAHNNV